jgi:hypothetical protein
MGPSETSGDPVQADFSEAGGVKIGHYQQINVGHATIFATCNFMSACRRWNEKETADKKWANFKVHFAASHRQHNQMQMQGESSVNSGYQAAKADVEQT